MKLCVIVKQRIVVCCVTADFSLLLLCHYLSEQNVCAIYSSWTTSLIVTIATQRQNWTYNLPTEAPWLHPLWIHYCLDNIFDISDSNYILRGCFVYVFSFFFYAWNPWSPVFPSTHAVSRNKKSLQSELDCTKTTKWKYNVTLSCLQRLRKSRGETLVCLWISAALLHLMRSISVPWRKAWILEGRSRGEALTRDSGNPLHSWWDLTELGLIVFPF